MLKTEQCSAHFEIIQCIFNLVIAKQQFRLETERLLIYKPVQDILNFLFYKNCKETHQENFLIEQYMFLEQ